MPVTQAECEEEGFFSDNIAERCMNCDSFLSTASSTTVALCLGAIADAGGADVIRNRMYDTYESLLQNYKDLFDIDLSTAINNPPRAVSESVDFYRRDEQYLTRTLGDNTLETDVTEYANRKIKCNSLKCGEDCSNDSDCYWHIPFDLDENARSTCSCEPNIFILKNDNLFGDSEIFGKESLQKKLAGDFYTIYAEELQRNCRPVALSEGLFLNYDRDEGRENIFCEDLQKTTEITEAIFSSQKNSNVKNIYEKCIDKEGTHRENILKQCLSRPIVFCKDENDDNQDCIHLNSSYYDLISDIFGYYVFRNTSYENPDRCECNLLEINEDTPPYYFFNEKEYLYKNYCEESINGIPRGICEKNMPIVHKYLEANEGQIDDADSSRENMREILNKNKCERTNSIKHNNIDYFHSRLFCDPINNYRTDINSDIDQMITNNFYEEVNDYNIRDNQKQTMPDNNLRVWDSVNGQYTDEIDYNMSNCTSKIHRCMGFEPVKTESEYYIDLYEKVLDSHYFLLPLDVSHITRDLEYLRYFSALNNHYIGDLTFSFPYGRLYGYMIETLHNLTYEEDLAPTIYAEQYEVVQALKSGEQIGAHVQDGQAGDEMGSIDRLELAETLQTVYKIDYLNSIRDYTIIALLLVCSAIFLYFYSYVILFVHIPWIIIYITYIKIKEYFS